MQKTKGLFAIIVGSVIVGGFLIGFLLQARASYYTKKECVKHSESFDGAAYSHKLAEGIDCTPYKLELDATYPD